MTHAKTLAIKLRWTLLILWVLCVTFGLVWLWGIYFDFGAGLMGTPISALFGSAVMTFGDVTWQIYACAVFIYAGLFFFTQWLFLCPGKLWKIKLSETPRPMKKAAVGVAFAAALLTAGLVYSILDLFFTDILDSPVFSGCIIIPIPLVLWLLWSVIFWVYLRQKDSFTWSGRIIRGLIAGSILELFVSIPIFVTRQDDCYCARGSYTGLVFGVTALLWAFGPGVFLLFLREKHRIEKLTAPHDGQVS